MFNNIVQEVFSFLYEPFYNEHMKNYLLYLRLFPVIIKYKRNFSELIW